jgi:rRNA maturation protein Rpf1
MSILLTTSLRPNPRVRSFCKDLASTSSIFHYITRGKMNMSAIFGYASSIRANRIWIVFSRYGNPGMINFFSLDENKKIGIIFIKGVALKRELRNAYSKSTKSNSIQLILKDEKLRGLYEVIKLALPSEGISNGENITRIEISRNKEGFAEIQFFDNKTNLICGPKIIVKGYVKENKVEFFK